MNELAYCMCLTSVCSMKKKSLKSNKQIEIIQKSSQLDKNNNNCIIKR